jgi:hypothetical protein
MLKLKKANKNKKQSKEQKYIHFVDEWIFEWLPLLAWELKSGMVIYLYEIVIEHFTVRSGKSIKPTNKSDFSFLMTGSKNGKLTKTDN